MRAMQSGYLTSANSRLWTSFLDTTDKFQVALAEFLYRFFILAEVPMVKDPTLVFIAFCIRHVCISFGSLFVLGNSILDYYAISNLFQ